MSDRDPDKLDELRELLQSVRYRLRALTIAVIVMAMMLTLTVAAVLGELINYHAGDNLLQGGVALIGVVVGFFAGWIARRRA